MTHGDKAATLSAPRQTELIIPRRSQGLSFPGYHLCLPRIDALASSVWPPRLPGGLHSQRAWVLSRHPAIPFTGSCLCSNGSLREGDLRPAPSVMTWVLPLGPRGGGENWLLRAVLWLPHLALQQVCVHTYTHTKRADKLILLFPIYVFTSETGSHWSFELTGIYLPLTLECCN